MLCHGNIRNRGSFTFEIYDSNLDPKKCRGRGRLIITKNNYEHQCLRLSSMTF